MISAISHSLKYDTVNQLAKVHKMYQLFQILYIEYILDSKFSNIKL